MKTICNEKMTVYALLGKVSRETDKLFYPDNWKLLFPVIDNILKDLPFKKVLSDQAFDKFLKLEKNGGIRMTGRNAATGGRMNWSRKNFEKVATKHLTNNQHLIYAFENSYRDMLLKYFERGREIITLRKHEIWGAIEPEPETKLDFVFRIMPCWDKNAFNQYANIFLSETLIEKLGTKEVAKLIDQVGILINQVRIGCTSRNWEHLIEMRGDIPVIDLIMIQTYTADENLNFKENKFGQWEIYDFAEQKH
jgi:hypothetical protein